jgi:DNA repair exonuclease SbcCD ATPase subunit
VGDGPTPDDAVKRAEADAAAAQEQAQRKAAEAREVAAAAQAAREKAFNQEDVNKFLAEDRRRHTEKYKKLEQSYKNILADKNLHQEQRGKLEAELQDLQKSFRTKEQQAQYELKQEREKFTSELTGFKEAATKWETMYKDSVIQRSLQDAAVSAEAFNPTQITGLLRGNTTMRPAIDEAGVEIENEMVPMVDFSDIDEKTGDRITTLRTPQEAVQRMKELPELYGNLFRANVVSGIGAGAATGGVTSGEGGRVDVSKLTPEQYRRMRKENPEALGLRRH